MHIFRGLYPDVDKEMKKIRYVVGKVEGPLDLADDEKVIFAGNCTSWKGEIDGEKVSIEGQYKRPHEIDETKTKSNDMLFKTVTTLFHAYKNRGSKYLHVKGCTLSVAEHVNYLSALAGVKNPHFDPRLSIGLTVSYCQMHFKRFFNRLLGALQF
jgi:methylaspartate ammonia-lyase